MNIGLRKLDDLTLSYLLFSRNIQSDSRFNRGFYWLWICS